MICDLKSKLSTQFDMKDLGVEKYILEMEIKRKRENRKLWLGQSKYKRKRENRKLWLGHSKYVNYALQCFHLIHCKPLSVPISMGTKHPVEQCPTTSSGMEDMAFVPCASVVGILMYVMVCSKPDIAQEVGVLSQLWLILDMNIELQWRGSLGICRVLLSIPFSIIVMFKGTNSQRIYRAM